MAKYKLELEIEDLPDEPAGALVIFTCKVCGKEIKARKDIYDKCYKDNNKCITCQNRESTVMDGKKIREITGYTYDNEKCNPKSWYESALAFHESANILYRAEKHTSKGTIATYFNAALSLELILKTIIAAKNKDIQPRHKLRDLSNDAGVKLDNDQKCLLDYLTEVIVWLKYPTPTERNKNDWDIFHDIIMEKLAIKTKSGKRANRKRIPSLENYMKLWDICLAKYIESTNS